jgi:hypothetical protein
MSEKLKGEHLSDLIVFRAELERTSYINHFWVKWWIGPEKIAIDSSEDGEIFTPLVGWKETMDPALLGKERYWWQSFSFP